MKTDQVTHTRFRKSQGVTGWYQSFDCSELGFLLESSLQSLGFSHENIFTTNKKIFHCIYESAKIHESNIYKGKTKAGTLVGRRIPQLKCHVRYSLRELDLPKTKRHRKQQTRVICDMLHLFACIY
ncbi:hypothetical protein HanRHA438_Chr07g0307081 [Helianthus annuus]|nr:hypothetical protein HanIR_Chr07g0320381 [Helianthus annuus]KAJ0908140.1 hypothetical protein HanRHA438_Chr07g0307081 [Helianthus annuus]